MNWRDFDFINNPIVVWGIVTEPGETTTQVLLVIHVLFSYTSQLLNYVCVGCLVQVQKLQVHFGLSSMSILLQYFSVHVKHQTMRIGLYQMG